MSEQPTWTGMAAAARCLALDAHAVRVVAALESAGVAAMVLKGPGLARRLYADDPSRRRYSDVDVLVAPDTFEQAQAVLARLGHHDLAADFPADEWLSYERSWRWEEASVPLTVDLHRGFAGVGDAAELSRLLFAHAEPLPLGAGVVAVPDVVGCALLVALHAASPGRGRKALNDLVTALGQLDDDVWRTASRWAGATRSSAAFAAGLRRDPAGAELADRLGLPTSSSRLARVAQRLDLVLLRRSLGALRDVDGFSAQVRYVARRLVPTPDFLRLGSPTARRGRAGLVLAYLLRPWRLLVPGRRLGTVPPAPDARRGARPHPAGDLHPQEWTWAKVRAAGWVLRALHDVRRGLATGPLEQVHPAAAPPAPAGTEVTVRRWLHRRRASCLERSLVLQRWWAGQGVVVDLVVGVTAPGSGFRAHAWLQGDADAGHSHDTMTEIVTRPTPAAWLRVG